MKIFATLEFKDEFEKLIKNKSYKYLSKEIITNYLDVSFSTTLSGTKLNGNSPNPFIKKRIGGSNGSRLYLLAVIVEEAIYFTFVHPKSGTSGYDNINDDKKAKLLKDVYESIKTGNLLEVSCCSERRTILFNSPKVVSIEEIV